MNENMRPVMPVSDAEKSALAELLPKLSTEGCSEKAAAIKEKARLTFDTPEANAVETPEFLLRQNHNERANLESQIAELRERGEHS